MSEWYEKTEDAAPAGPFSKEQLQQRLATNQITRETQVRREHETGWRTVGEVLEANPSIPSSAAPRSSRSWLVGVVVGLLFVIGLAVGGWKFATREQLPPWSAGLGGFELNYLALNRNDQQTKLLVQFSPPRLEPVENKSGRDWQTWVHYDITLSYEVAGKTLDSFQNGLMIDGAGIERAAIIAGDRDFPQPGGKAKRVLLIPNVPTARKVVMPTVESGEIILEFSDGKWSHTLSAANQRLVEKNKQAEEAKIKIQKELKTLARINKCCDAIHALLNKDSELKDVNDIKVADILCGMVIVRSDPLPRMQEVRSLFGKYPVPAACTQEALEGTGDDPR